MAYSRRNGRNGGTQEAPPQEKQGSKNEPIFKRRLFTPGGTLEVAVFETFKKGNNGKEYSNFFASVNRSYRKEDGSYENTSLLNPADLLVVADMLKVAWEYILDESNRE